MPPALFFYQNCFDHLGLHGSIQMLVLFFLERGISIHQIQYYYGNFYVDNFSFTIQSTNTYFTINKYYMPILVLDAEDEQLIKSNMIMYFMEL